MKKKLGSFVLVLLLVLTVVALQRIDMPQTATVVKSADSTARL